MVDSVALNSQLVDNALLLNPGSDTVFIPDAQTLDRLKRVLVIRAAPNTDALIATLEQYLHEELIELLGIYHVLFGFVDWSSDEKFFDRFASPDMIFTVTAQCALKKAICQLGSRSLTQREEGACADKEGGPLADRYASAQDEQDVVLWRFVGRRYEKEILSARSWPSRAKTGVDCVNCIAWSPDNSTVAIGLDCGSVILWRDGVRVGLLKGHFGPVSVIAWSHDGSLLATASWDCMVRIWCVAQGTCCRVIEQRQHIDALAFGHDNKMLAIRIGFSVTMWDLQTGGYIGWGSIGDHGRTRYVEPNPVQSDTCNALLAAVKRGESESSMQFWKRMLARTYLTPLQKLFLLKCADGGVTPFEQHNLQPLVQTLPKAALAFVIQCGWQW